MTAQHLAALTSPVSYKPKVYLTQGGLLIVSRLFSSSTPPPIKSTTITTTLNPAFLFLHPPHLPTSYLRELGENQSFVRAYMLLQPALLPSQGISLLSLGGQHGMEGQNGRGDIIWRDQECKVTQVGALVAVEFLWQTDCNTLGHFFSPLLSISVQFTPVTSPPPLPPHCSVIQREGKPSSSLLQQPVGGPRNPKWYVRPFFVLCLWSFSVAD